MCIGRKNFGRDFRSTRQLTHFYPLRTRETCMHALGQMGSGDPMAIEKCSGEAPMRPRGAYQGPLVLWSKVICRIRCVIYVLFVWGCAIVLAPIPKLLRLCGISLVLVLTKLILMVLTKANIIKQVVVV